MEIHLGSILHTLVILRAEHGLFLREALGAFIISMVFFHGRIGTAIGVAIATWAVLVGYAYIVLNLLDPNWMYALALIVGLVMFIWTRSTREHDLELQAS